MISPDLTIVVWVETILTNMIIPKSNRQIRPKKVKYPIPEIPDDSEKKSGTDWVLPKIIGSGRVSGTRLSLIIELSEHKVLLLKLKHLLDCLLNKYICVQVSFQ